MRRKVYITITGTCHYLGDEFLKEGTWVMLIKDPDNKYDREAIRVEMEGLGKIGYVANSTCTVLGESFSAGRLYDKIGDRAAAKVEYLLPKGIICSVRTKDLVGWPPRAHKDSDGIALQSGPSKRQSPVPEGTEDNKKEVSP